jgi:hypothetical protein
MGSNYCLLARMNVNTAYASQHMGPHLQMYRDMVTVEHWYTTIVPRSVLSISQGSSPQVPDLRLAERHLAAPISQLLSAFPYGGS